MIAVLWFAALGEVPLLNKVIDNLSHLRLAGYGLDITDLEQRRVTVALVGSVMGAYLTTSFFAIGWMDGSMKAVKSFFAFTGCLLGIVFCGIWVKFLRDDHILTTSDKMELFGLSMFLGLGSIALCWLGFRKRNSRSFSKHTAKSNRPFVESQTTQESTDQTDLPSVETLLENESSPESEGDEESTPAEESVEGPSELPESGEQPPVSAAEVDGPAEEAVGEGEPAPVEESVEGPPELPESVEQPPVPAAEAGSEIPPPMPEPAENVPPALPSAETHVSSAEASPPLLPKEDDGGTAEITNRPT